MSAYKKIILVIITVIFAGSICAIDAMSAPPVAPPGGGQQICQSGPCVDSTAIIDGQVNSQDLAVGAVGSAQLQDNAVTGAKVLDGSIGTADIAPGAVGTGQLADGVVTGAKVLDGSIGTSDIAVGAIGTAQLADGAVSGAKVQAGSLSGTHIQAGSLTGLQILDNSIVSSDIAPGAVGTGQLSDGAVTGAKVQAGSLTSAHIQDGSIDTTKVGFNYAGSNSKGGPALDLTCTGCVSKSELDFSIAGSPARRVVVAASGGDYTSVSAALAAINPSAAEPYVIDIMPGQYYETITMKSYVHLRGAGREVTTLRHGPSNVINIINCTNVAISGLKIMNGVNGIDIQSSTAISITNNIISNAGQFGLYLSNAPVVYITGNIITANQYCGMSIRNESSPVISGNQIIRQSWGPGISINNAPAPIIIGNVITGNFAQGIVMYNDSSPIISGNTITGNNTSNSNNGAGIQIGNSNCNAKITHNVITGTMENTAIGSYSYDIYVVGGSAPNISFNVYDRLYGTSGVGLYNVNSNGDPAPAP